MNGVFLQSWFRCRGVCLIRDNSSVKRSESLARNFLRQLCMLSEEMMTILMNARQRYLHTTLLPCRYHSFCHSGEDRNKMIKSAKLYYAKSTCYAEQAKLGSTNRNLTLTASDLCPYRRSRPRSQTHADQTQHQLDSAPRQDSTESQSPDRSSRLRDSSQQSTSASY
jgi:hypothetical protein